MQVVCTVRSNYYMLLLANNYAGNACESWPLATYVGSRSVALVLGTSIGGLLVTPALHYPDVFSSTGIFARYVLDLSDMR